MPIPIEIRGTLQCAAFYFARMGLPPRQDHDLYPPTWLVTLDWLTGAVISMQPSEPPAFGVGTSRYRPFASVSYPSMNAAAAANGLGNLTERESALNAAYDRLVPAWHARRSLPSVDATAFLRLFKSFAEPPFVPVYARLGDAFFQTVEAAAS